jgi:hypothetical protein
MTTHNQRGDGTHPLHDKWDMYYHLPHEKCWDLSSYRTVLSKFDTLEEVITLNDVLISEYIVQHSMLFVMRQGITPMWEDVKNRNGGCFSFRVPNKFVHPIWKSLMYALCGETLFMDRANSKHVNGITVSPKKNFCIIKVWMDSCEIMDPNSMINIPNLSKQGCLFKKHEPEF